MNRYLLIFIAIFCLGIKAYSQEQEIVYSLPEALKAARENNPALKANRMNIQLAEGDLITARLRPNPVVSWNGIQIANSSDFEPDLPWNNRLHQQSAWELTKEIQLPSQRKRSIKLAQNLVNVSSASYLEEERNLLLEVAMQWLEVWVAQKRAEELRISKNNLDSLVIINKYQYEKHIISKTDLYRTELLAHQYDLQYSASLVELENQKKMLRYFLGTTANITTDSSDSVMHTITTPLDSLLTTAMRERSDIQMLQTSIQAANTNIMLQKALAIPKPELGLIYSPQNMVPYVGVSLAIDIPVFNRNQGERKRAFWEKSQFEEEYLNTKNLLNTEVSSVYDTYVFNYKNFNQYKEFLIQSKEILNSVQYAYLKGGTTIIDFLEAQRSWLETYGEYYNALLAYRQSYVQLLYVTGLINQLEIL